MRARSFYKSLITLFTHRIRAIDSFVHQDNRYSTTLRPIGSSNNSSPVISSPWKEEKKETGSSLGNGGRARGKEEIRAALTGRKTSIKAGLVTLVSEELGGSGPDPLA